MVQQRAALILAWVLTALIALGIGLLYDRMKMIPEGKTDVFWAQLMEKPHDGGWGEDEGYCIDGEYYYTVQYIPGIRVFHVDAAEVQKELLSQTHWLHDYCVEHPDAWQAPAYQTWIIRTEYKYPDDDATTQPPTTVPTTAASSEARQKFLLQQPSRGYVSPKPTPRTEPIATTRPARPDEMTLPDLIYKLQEAQDSARCKKGISSRWRGQIDALVWQQVADARFHWAAALFEFVFLSGLVWFLLWPFIRRHGPLSCALHLGLGPILFYLPTFFGYIPNLGFTGNGVVAYPSGGILYPRLVLFLRIPLILTGCEPMGDAEDHLLSYIPKFLRSLAGGFPSTSTYDGLRGPSLISILIADLVVFLAAYLILRFLRRVRDKAG